MAALAVCESLETRSLCAATPALDANYDLPLTEIHRAAGKNVVIYQAVPAPGDSTYLLAERHADPNDTFSTGYLTIIRLNNKGQLDNTFGTGGIALTGRVTQTHDPFDRSGLLRIDAGGRLYFVDDYRVFRFHADGTTDRSFGDNGAIAFASADQKVALSDVLPLDNGVLVATTKTLRGVQYFAVQRVTGKSARTTFTASHDTGAKSENQSGSFYKGQQELATDAMQFTQNAKGIVLARVETDHSFYQQHAPPDADDPDEIYTLVGVKAQSVVVTRLDTAGGGVDVARQSLRRRSENDATSLGNLFRRDSFFDNSNLLLSGDGRYLTVQTDQEIMRLDLRRNTAKHFSIPPALYQNFSPVYQLLGDGALYAVDQVIGRNFEPVITVTRYSYDGVLDTKFGRRGVLTINPPDAVPATFTDQLFLGASGRLYFLNDGMTTTLRRL